MTEPERPPEADFDPVDMVVEYVRGDITTEVRCHVGACSWKQVLPTLISDTVARVHVWSVHRQAMVGVKRDLDTTSRELRKEVAMMRGEEPK